jgi:flagellar hook-basal body complex protein FliE
MVAPLRPTQPFVIPKLDMAKVATPSAPSVSSPSAPSAGAPGVGGQSAVSFTDKLREVVQQTNELPQQGEQVAQQYADGKQNDLHGTMVSMAQADISLRMVANVRNRAIEAYREIMRMGS